MINLKLGFIEGVITIFKGNDPSALEKLTEFNNLVTDNGLRLFGSSSLYCQYCNIGSGSTTPSVSDTSLANRLRGSFTTSTADVFGVDNSDALNPFVYKRRRIRFAPTGSAYNVSEIAFGEDAAGLNLFNRVLVKDGGGSPISLSILGDEHLDVQLEVRVYPPLSDMSGTVGPTGKDTATRSWVARAAGSGGTLTSNYEAWEASGGLVGANSTSALAYTGALPAIFSAPTGSIGSSTSNTAVLAPTGSSYTRTISADLSKWNGSIRTVRLHGNGNNINIEFTPAFTKTTDDTFELKYKLSWGRK